ncbi:MAG TPA: glycolate oxidase subunit GlcF [Steroidobacteraceae bacterium]|jgi:glycolate oxidase iron-sulfur subunit|nr:glycolate oxidase subunit GlcF [Steroidobacteraceae bacterium]
MQADLTPELESSADGVEARAIVRKCVHCGFCNATCPTYQLLGDELDGPRGRIYLIKQVLEGAEVTRSTQLHLDRCLTCRNCETTCPSGVEYGHLVEIGRKLVDSKVERPIGERAVRWALKEGMTSPAFAPALRIGQAVRPLLPAALRKNVPPAAAARSVLEASSPGARAAARRTVILLQGCVQPALMPGIDAAAERVLRRAGIETLRIRTACCGAVRAHLGDPEGGREHMRANIEAWAPLLADGRADAVVTSASACTLAIKEYGHALAGDPDYRDRAERIGALARDLSELLPEIVAALAPEIDGKRFGPLAYHPPCTLQHGQRLRGGVESALRELGFDVRVAARDVNLCCGSAGTYSVLQPAIANELRDRKLRDLHGAEPSCIVSSNMGCIRHLQSGTGTPVRHWIEVLDDALTPR